MGIISRMVRVFKSNLNHSISKAEDTEKMLNQLLEEMHQQLQDVTRSVAAAIADEKRAERQLQEQLSLSRDWERRAVLALKAGKEDLAREALERKQLNDDYATEYQKQWEAHHAGVEKLKTHLRELQAKIDDANRRKNLLVARAKRAEAQKRFHETVGGLSDTSAFAAFDKMDKKIADLEAETEALGQLVDSRSGQDELESKFQALEKESDSTTEAMLDNLKQRLALDHTPAGGTGAEAAVKPPEEDELEALKRKLREYT